MKELKGIFTSAKGSLSSKRVFGGMGLLIIFGCFIYAVVTSVSLPDCTEFLTGSCAGLLGVDSVANALKKD